MKRLQGLIAATVTTMVISLGMFVIGVSAAVNTNRVPVSNSPAQASLAANTTAAKASAKAAPDAAQAQIDQLQNLIKQYQEREQQYQTEIKSQAQKLADATNQANTLQQVLVALQQRGLIQITRDGRIFIAGG